MKRKINIIVITLLTFALPAFAQFNSPIDDDTMPWTLGPVQKEGISSTNMFYENMLEEEGTANYYLKYRDELKLTQDQVSQIQKLRLKEIESQSDIKKQYKIAIQ